MRFDLPRLTRMQTFSWTLPPLGGFFVSWGCFGFSAPKSIVTDSSFRTQRMPQRILLQFRVISRAFTRILWRVRWYFRANRIDSQHLPSFLLRPDQPIDSASILLDNYSVEQLSLDYPELLRLIQPAWWSSSDKNLPRSVTFPRRSENSTTAMSSCCFRSSPRQFGCSVQLHCPEALPANDEPGPNENWARIARATISLFICDTIVFCENRRHILHVFNNQRQGSIYSIARSAPFVSFIEMLFYHRTDFSAVLKCSFIIPLLCQKDPSSVELCASMTVPVCHLLDLHWASHWWK